MPSSRAVESFLFVINRVSASRPPPPSTAATQTEAACWDLLSRAVRTRAGERIIALGRFKLQIRMALEFDSLFSGLILAKTK